MKNVKVKSHSGTKKRFKITKNGKVKYQTTNKRHRLTQKETKRKRIARKKCIVSNANAPVIKQLIPY